MLRNLDELQYFVAVSDTQSFTRAATHLGVPKSTVSRTIRRLEDRLGVRLIERTTRRVALTEVGQLYLTHCQRVMEEAEQADLAVSALLAEPRGRLRIGVPVALADFIVGPVFADFQARYPGLSVDVELLHGDMFPRDGSLDVLFRAGSVGDSGLTVRWLMRVWQGVYASPSYLEGHPAPESPTQLRRHVCIAASCDTAGGAPVGSTTWRLRRAGERAEVGMEARVTIPHPAMIHRLTLAAIGIAMLSRTTAKADVEAGRLIHLLPEWEPEPVELHAFYPSRLNASPKVRALLDFLKESQSHF